MKLTNIHIHRGYGHNEPLRGEIKFRGTGGHEMKLKLDEQLSTEVVALCADSIVRASIAAAESLKQDGIGGQLLEHDGGKENASE